MASEDLATVDAIVGRVAHLRQRMSRPRVPATEAVAGFDEVTEQLTTVIEELHISNEELQRALTDLQVERSRYRDLFHSSPDPHLLTDGEGVVTDANRAAGTLVGCPSEALAGRRLLDLVARPGMPDAAHHVRRARRGASGEAVWPLLRRDGSTRLAQVRYVPLAGARDEGQGAQWVLQDLEQPLFEAEDRAVESPQLARRWLNVYAELTAATEALVEEAAQAAERLAQPARAAFEEAQVHALDGRLARLRQGLAYWRRRHAALVDLDFDLASPDVGHGDRTVRTSLRERQLLNALLGHPGRTLTARALLTQAWHSPYLTEEQLRTYVVRLRRKLEHLGAPCTLVNRRGHGYALVFDARGEPDGS